MSTFKHDQYEWEVDFRSIAILISRISLSLKINSPVLLCVSACSGRV